MSLDNVVATEQQLYELYKACEGPELIYRGAIDPANRRWINVETPKRYLTSLRDVMFIEYRRLPQQEGNADARASASYYPVGLPYRWIVYHLADSRGHIRGFAVEYSVDPDDARNAQIEPEQIVKKLLRKVYGSTGKRNRSKDEGSKRETLFSEEIAYLINFLNGLKSKELAANP